MNIRPRQHNHVSDFARVGDFLVKTCGSSCRRHVNWLQPRWEYMHYHPQIRNVDLSSIGVWEKGREFVAVVHPELHMGTAYFEFSPEHPDLKRDVLTYAEKHLSRATERGRRLSVYVNDRDRELQEFAAAEGYRKDDSSESMSQLTIPDPFPPIRLPDGFRLTSLAEDNDLRKLHSLLWRGFGHGSEPLDDGIAERRLMQSAPHFKKDLSIVVEAPDGSFASYCGMWFEPVHRVAYVEPVATDPDYRRMGLGTAVVREGIRRCGKAGAKVAYVATSLPLYQSIGFREVYRISGWRKEWSQQPTPTLDNWPRWPRIAEK